MEPGDRVNIILTITRALEDRDWPEIDLILSEFDLPTSEDTHGGAANYIQAMLRGSDEANMVSLHEYLGGEVIERPVSAEAMRRIWPADGFRLFLSHSSEAAVFVDGVRSELEPLGVSGFVAHDDVEPSREWEEEILNALNSCEALAAFLHPDFHERLWTDHEVGHALGRGVLVIPLMFEKQRPYGFLGRFQGVPCDDLGHKEIAVLLLDILSKNELTQTALSPHLVTRIERSTTANRANSFLSRLDRVSKLPIALLKRLDEARRTNDSLVGEEARTTIDGIFARNDYTPEVVWEPADEDAF